MFRTIIAALTAVSLSVAPGAASARGLDEDQLGRLIIGLVAAGIIGKVLSDRQDNDHIEPAPRVQALPAPKPRYVPQNDTITMPQRPFGQHWERDDARRQWADPSVLPSACLQSHDTQRGFQTIFASDCLAQTYNFAQQLPDQCGIRLRTYAGPRLGYDPSCLRDYGYRSDVNR